MQVAAIERTPSFYSQVVQATGHDMVGLAMEIVTGKYQTNHMDYQAQLSYARAAVAHCLQEGEEVVPTEIAFSVALDLGYGALTPIRQSASL